MTGIFTGISQHHRSFLVKDTLQKIKKLNGKSKHADFDKQIGIKKQKVELLKKLIALKSFKN